MQKSDQKWFYRLIELLDYKENGNGFTKEKMDGQRFAVVQNSSRGTPENTWKRNNRIVEGGETGNGKGRRVVGSERYL